MNDPRKPWQILGDSEIEDFTIFKARKSKRVNPRTGKTFDFFLLQGMDWCNIVALTPQREMVLVRQYRHGIDDYTLELPGGCVDPGEDPKKAVLRELQEETGYRASDAALLGKVWANPAMMSIACHFYFAENVAPSGKVSLDDGEDIETVLLPLEEVLHLARNGKFAHGLHLSALGLYAMIHK